MKIKYVKAWPLEAPRPGISSDKPDHYLPYWKELAEAGVRSKYYACLVEIGTDDNIVGWGEALVREVPTAHREIIEKLLAPIIINQDPLAIEDLWQKMFSALKTRGHISGYFIEALSGVDIALWDIFGKVMRQPVYRLLGGPTADRIKCYASSIYWHYFKEIKPEVIINEILKLKEEGHNQVKIKIGMGKLGLGKDIDIEILKIIRNNIGYDIEIIVDANSAYSLNEALRIGRMLEKYDVLWFEEPLPPDRVDDYSELKRKLDIMIAGGESLFTKYTFYNFIKKRALDVIQPDVARCGGITEFRKIVTLCETEGLYLAPHIGLSGPGCRAATLHISAAIPREIFLTYEYMYKNDNPLAIEIPSEVLEKYSNGSLELPKGPGLGFLPRKEILTKYLSL